jgi:thioredoxin:protein disulfide reductase
MKFRKILFVLALCSLNLTSFADNTKSKTEIKTNQNLSLISNSNLDQNYLSPEDAFHFQAFMVAPNKILAQWIAQDGYHFYHDKFQFFTTSGVLLGEAKIDKGEMVFNKALNQTLEENKGMVNITIPIIAHKPGEFEIIAVSQGCADNLCYPPQKRTIKLKIQ